MLTTPHAVAGATIGTLLPNPLIAVPAAVASHFILDSIPHWQETLAPYIPTKKTYIRIPLDLLLAVLLVILITHWNPQHIRTIWLGAFFANLPDFDSLVILFPRLKGGIIRRFWNWHCKIQRETNSMIGVYTQVIFVGFCLAVAYVQR